MNIKKFKFYILVVLAALSLVLILFSTVLGYDPERFGSILQTYGVPELLFILWVILATATTLPISAVMIAGIIYFSFFYAMAYTFIGMLIGSIGTFYASRWLGKDFVKEAAGLKGTGRIHIFNQLIHEHSLVYVILLAFVYGFPSNLAYMLGGVTDVKFRDMMLIIIFGNLTTALGVGWIILGVVGGSLRFILGGAALILLVNVIPLAMYWQHLKKLVVLAYSEKAYRKLVEAERMIEKDYGIPLPKKRQV
jgi:uncharacterized membrane protein YdjX (TVP38/TMEM64 family)